MSACPNINFDPIAYNNAVNTDFYDLVAPGIAAGQALVNGQFSRTQAARSSNGNVNTYHREHIYEMQLCELTHNKSLLLLTEIFSVPVYEFPRDR